MKRFHGFHVICLWSSMFLVSAGCATVNPAGDYQQAARRISEATGHEQVYRPDEEETIAVRVEALLADGLTADEAVRVGLLNHAGLQAAWMEIGMARADLVQSGLLSNPSLGGSLRLPAGGGLANLELTLAQNVADLWQIPVRREIAQAGIEQAILSLARQAADLSAQIRQTYYRCIGAMQLQETAGDNLAVTRQLLELALNRQKAGAGGELDVNLSRSAMLEAELALESSKLNAAEDRRELARLLGLTMNADTLALADAFPEPISGSWDTEAAVAYARSRRPDLLAAEQNVQEAEARLKAEYVKIWPVVEIGLAMERGERQAQGGRDLLADTARASVANGRLTAPEIEPRSANRQHTDFIIGPSWNLELPIFDQNQARIARAYYEHQQALKSLRNLECQAIQEIRGAMDRMITNWNIVGLYTEQFMPLARSNLELSRESYKAGRASFLSVLEAQRFYLDTRRRAIEAHQTAAATVPELERVVGAPFAELWKAVSGLPTSQPVTHHTIEGAQR